MANAHPAVATAQIFQQSNWEGRLVLVRAFSSVKLETLSLEAGAGNDRPGIGIQGTHLEQSEHGNGPDNRGEERARRPWD